MGNDFLTVCACNECAHICYKELGMLSGSVQQILQNYAMLALQPGRCYDVNFYGCQLVVSLAPRRGKPKSALCSSCSPGGAMRPLLIASANPRRSKPKHQYYRLSHVTVPVLALAFTSIPPVFRRGRAGQKDSSCEYLYQNGYEGAQQNRTQREVRNTGNHHPLMYTRHLRVMTVVALLLPAITLGAPHFK